MLPLDSGPAGIKKLIQQGESETVEFKLRLPREAVIARTFAAFANTKGGTLIIGVADDGEIVGLSGAEGREAWERLQKIADSMDLPVRIGLTAVDGRRVAHASFDPAPDHLRPIVTSSGEAYQREFDDDRPVSIRQFLSSTSAVRTPTEVTTPVNVFVAMSFRTEEEPALEDYFRAMERAAKNSDLPIDIALISQKEGDYEISQEIMNEIDECNVLIADLTLNPNNVYLELGYARGRRIRVIQTARADTSLEFDTRNWRTTFYRNATELESKLEAELVAAYEEVTQELGEGSC